MLLCPLLLGRSLPGQLYGLLEGFRGLGGFHFNIGLPWCLALLLSLGLPSSLLPLAPPESLHQDQGVLGICPL